MCLCFWGLCPGGYSRGGIVPEVIYGGGGLVQRGIVQGGLGVLSRRNYPASGGGRERVCHPVVKHKPICLFNNGS